MHAPAASDSEACTAICEEIVCAPYFKTWVTRCNGRCIFHTWSLSESDSDEEMNSLDFGILKQKLRWESIFDSIILSICMQQQLVLVKSNKKTEHRRNIHWPITVTYLDYFFFVCLFIECKPFPQSFVYIRNPDLDPKIIYANHRGLFPLKNMIAPVMKKLNSPNSVLFITEFYIEQRPSYVFPFLAMKLQS